MRHQSQCAESHNRYNILSIEEIEESEDSRDNKITFNSNLPSEGSPSGLARDVKPGLNSSNKSNKNIIEEIPEDAFVHSVRPT